MKNIDKLIIRNGFLLVVTCLLAGIQNGMAQLNPSGSAYFQNQYLLNPAMAGVAEDNMNINLSYRQQASNINSSANVQMLTADYRFTEKAGVGLNIYHQNAGLLQASRILATYAYHLPITDNQNLHFGLSAGAIYESINEDKLSGDLGDPAVAMFNDKGIQFDGDFGIGYSIGNLTVQAAGLHLLSLTEDEDSFITSIRQPTIFAAAEHKFSLREGKDAIHLTPKAVYRHVKEFKEVIDIGAQVDFLDEKVNFSTMYHTSQSATFGLGAKIKQTAVLSGMYTTDAQDYDGKAGSDFEISLNILLGRTLK